MYSGYTRFSGSSEAGANVTDNKNLEDSWGNREAITGGEGEEEEGREMDELGPFGLGRQKATSTTEYVHNLTSTILRLQLRGRFK